METTTDSAKKSETASDSGGATGSDGGSKSSGSSGSDGTPKSYSRGENQKPVTDAYRDNWNHIFKRGKSRKR